MPSPSVLDLNLEATPDLEAVEAGEYELELVSMKYGLSKKGNDMVTTWFQIPSAANAPPVGKWYCMPLKSDEPTMAENRRRDFKNLATVLGIDLNTLQSAIESAQAEFKETGEPAKIEQFKNSKCKAILKTTPIVDSDQLRNEISRFL